MREHALAIFNAAVSGVQPSRLLPRNIRLEKDILWLNGQPFSIKEWEHIYVIGAGKASAAMALETENILGNYIEKGIVVTKYNHALPLQKIHCIEAGHPLPDDNSISAGKAIMKIVQQAGEKDIIISLISGGASALLADHPPGISINHLQELFELLLRSGATIDEMNIVRKHLSEIKGGQLARAAYPATMVSLILSDVIGDPLDVIASGPTAPDPASFNDAYEVLEKYKLREKVHPVIMEWIQKGLDGSIPDTPKTGDKIFKRTFNHLIANNRIALKAAAEKARALGYAPFILTGKLKGEAREQAREFIEYLSKQYCTKPACILMGGETTVTIKGRGKGGRNQEFALAALVELTKNYSVNERPIPLILSAGTDGSDGPTDATGAMVDAETIDAVKKLSLEVTAYLNDNDSYNFFRQAGGHIITGPTQTNVMDIVIALL